MHLWFGNAKPGHPYCWDGATAPDLPNKSPKYTDILIIGAGYTDLSAAIAPITPGPLSVSLTPVFLVPGASTRKGGMCGSHPRFGWQFLADAFGTHTEDTLFAEATPALNFIRELITRENINCDLQQTGRIQLAYTAAQLKRKNSSRHISPRKVTFRCV